MRVTDLRVHTLAAELPAPMRSRGSPGYREYFHTGSERQRITAVELLTDTGRTGITLLGGDARGFLDAVARPALAGIDPAAVRRARAGLLQGLRAAPDALQRAGAGHVNRLEFALWDLKAQEAGLPLFRLLGGADPEVDVYAGGGSLCWNPLPLLLEETDRLLERGFRALKIKIGHGPTEDRELVRAIRRRCGPEVRLMVDANRAYDLAGALALCEELEAQEIAWFEEPFVYEEPQVWRALRERTAVPLAGGEGFHRLAEAAEALREGIVGLLQCDAGAFGLVELLAIGAIAHERGVRLTPHSCNNAIGFLASCHLQRALPNGSMQEYETFDNPFVHSMLDGIPEVREGKLRLTERPGLGVTLNPETLARYRA